MISYEEIFKYTQIFNPISPSALLSTGKLANLEPQMTVLDIGGGKGYPSIL